MTMRRWAPAALFLLVSWAGAFVIAWIVVEWRADDADDTAREVLSTWNMDVPAEERADLNRQFLAGEVEGWGGDAGEKPSEQLYAALSRIANIAALPLIRSDLDAATSPKQMLDRLTECIEYLMGTHNAGVACNLQSIAR
jgi:hypothetical protein